MKHAQKIYSNTFYYFKSINPIKRYTSFTFTELSSFEDVLSCYCEKGEIVKIGEKYFEFAKKTTAESSQPQQPQIIFKDRKKIIYKKTI